MDINEDFTHRDEIHGDVEYDPLAVALLNTSAMQRLGRVYQLGYGHLVYRGGTHTRLSHCMGAYATALRMANALERSYQRRRKLPKGAIGPEEFLPRRPAQGEGELTLSIGLDPLPGQPADRWTVLRSLVGWAALLHDLGHVPLGHTLEDEFEGLYEKHDNFASPRLRHLWVAGVEGSHSEIAEVLGRRELYPEAFASLGITGGDDVWAAVFLICTWKEKIVEGTRTPFERLLRDEIEGSRESPVAELLLDALGRVAGSLFRPYMADIVANTISADYLDYLRRDPHNLGLDVLRDDRVVSRFFVGRDHLGQERMALSLVDRRGKSRLDTCTGVVELVRQRFRFAEIVYYHKTKVAASAMLARVFSYLGAPEEIPAIRDLPAAESIEREVEGLLSAKANKRQARMRELKSAMLPSSLLDPEIGDESLHLLLRYRAWELFEQSAGADDAEGASRALRAVSLLDSIAKRKLHKVAFTMDRDAFGELSGKARSSEPEGKRALQELIDELRKGNENRERLEGTLAASAGGWSDASLLLYVPPRKSQAKGIETGALAADGSVIPLGDHFAVKAQVEELSDQYQRLWRLIVLVHPDKAGDAVGLSRAVDQLAEELFAGIDLDDNRVIAELTSCCWFTYLSRRDRDAATRYRDLLDGAADDDVDWEAIRQFDGLVDGGADDEERALGAALLRRATLALDNPSAAEELIRKRFSVPGSLSEWINRERGQIQASASRLGPSDVDAETRATIAVLEQLCTELLDGR